MNVVSLYRVRFLDKYGVKSYSVYDFDYHSITFKNLLTWAVILQLRRYR